MSYPFDSIELKWQARWDQEKSFAAEDLSAKPKYYVLDMFPYPSGAGLHVGHPEGYTATDIVSRAKRMQGFNVLHPIGWDAFGLPAEQYALQTGTHPAQTTKQNVENFKRQIKRLGFSYDWDRVIDTTDPNYFKWTQWIFLQLYKKGLAYMQGAPVWWCPECGTVLANEEIVEGRCERKSHLVERKPMLQWMLKITAYAERLLADLEALDWPEHIKQMQRNWIGRSEGVDVWFALDNINAVSADIVDDERVRIQNGQPQFKIYTTRPDTLFGVTYMVLSPEHPLVAEITASDRLDAVKKYQQQASRKSEMERTELAKEKTGVFTGANAINPLNGKKIPIWIADYVLASYGTGAIMAVPAHDQRDFEFAQTFDLPIDVVIVPEGFDMNQTLHEAVPAAGLMHHSGDFTGMPSDEAKIKITAKLEADGMGQGAVNYKLRDWLFSRQRYWGEPIPVVHCQGECGIVPLNESDLPLQLPDMPDFKPTGTGEPPLAKAKDWVNTQCPNCDGPAQRELNTMPQWAGSCWYYLRYIDAHNDQAAWDPAKEKYWMSVDLYVGGAEHAVLHLLYSRFWHHVLFDLGLVSTPEPFKKLINQGLILGEDGEKMSKSRGNVVNPDDVIRQYGADAFRLYEMFMGPLEAVKPWSMNNIEGVDRFLNKLWRLVVKEDTLNDKVQSVPLEGDLKQLVHKTIKQVTDDVEALRLNTAISAMMILLNNLQTQDKAPQEAVEILVLLLAPFAPHIAEELWERLGHTEGLSHAPWPRYDEKALVSSEIQFVVQVNGKTRLQLMVGAQASDEEIKALALEHETVQKHMAGKPLRKCIVVPKRLINLVV